MLKKLLWKLIKIPLSPLFTALWVFRKIKGAISKAIWGSKKAASTATSASETAASAASKTTEQQRETDATAVESEPADRRVRESEAESKRDRQPASAHDAEAERQYGRFESLLAGYAAYVFFLPFLTVLFLSIPFRYVPIAELFGNGLRIAILPAIVAGVARVRSKAAWYVAFGVTALIFGLQALSLVGIVGVESMGLGTADVSIAQDEPALFVLILAEFALLGASLRAGWAGRQVALGGGASAAGGEAGTPTPPADSAGREPAAPEATAREEERDERSTRQPSRSAAGAASADADRRSSADRGAGTTSGTDPSGNSAEPTADSTGSPAGNGASTDVGAGSDNGDDPTHDPDRTDAADHDSGADADPGSDPDHDSAPERNPELEAAVERVRGEDVTPEAVRELRAVLPDDELPATAATTLEALADRDDPEIRLAACDVCAAVDDERAEDILKSRRIDRDDRVANAAIEALR